MSYRMIGRQILDLLEQNFGSSTFKAYFYGDTDLIGQSNLPCIVVQESAVDVTVDHTAQDTQTKTLTIKVIFNKKSDWGASPDEDTTFKKIQDIIEKRTDLTDTYGNPASSYDPATILGILRTNFTLGSYVVDQHMKIAYGPVKRPEDTYTMEGHITLTVSEYVFVPDRT